MDNLHPGGWIEMQEYDAWIFSDDDSFERAPWTREWVEKLDAASKMYGKQINVTKYQKRWMMDAGFEDVQETVHRIPIGPWAKDATQGDRPLRARPYADVSRLAYTRPLHLRPELFARPGHGPDGGGQTRVQEP